MTHFNGRVLVVRICQTSHVVYRLADFNLGHDSVCVHVRKGEELVRSDSLRWVVAVE